MNSGNMFFEHKYPSIDINRAIEKMRSFEDFERYYTTDLMDENQHVNGVYNRTIVEVKEGQRHRGRCPSRQFDR